MSKFQESRTYAGKTADDCYAAAEKILPEVGFEVWKRRPMAWLLQAKRKQAEGSIDANLVCRLGANTMVILTLSSNTISQEVLKSIAEEIFSMLETQLN